MKYFAFTLAVLAVVSASNGPIPDLSGAESVAFNTTDDDLPWPLPDNDDLTTIMIHGVHCKIMIEKPQLTMFLTDMEQMHRTHCAKLVDAIEGESKGKMIPKDVCDTIFKVNAKYFDVHKVLGSYTYYFDDVLEQIATTGVVNRPKYNLPRMGGYNYGNMLMKEWHASTAGGPALTSAEKTYVDSFFTKGRLQQAAIASTCQREHGIGFVVTDSKVGNLQALPGCTSDKDCPSSYCMNDKTKTPPYTCHTYPGCMSDKDCPSSYCMNDKTKTPPYTCH